MFRLFKLLGEKKQLLHTYYKLYGIFSEWALEKLNENPVFYSEILFSDESHFWLNAYVNKKYCRIWADEYQEQPLCPLKTTVSCGLWADGIIGPYFFNNEANQNVNGLCDS